jgi:hypothetical protein
MEIDLKQILEWCEANEVSFKISIEAGLLSVAGRNGNLFAEYPIEEPLTPETVGQSVCAALYSIKCGTEFHATNGHLPDFGAAVGSSEVGDRESSFSIPTVPSTTPQGVRSDPES